MVREVSNFEKRYFAGWVSHFRGWISDFGMWVSDFGGWVSGFGVFLANLEFLRVSPF